VETADSGAGHRRLRVSRISGGGLLAAGAAAARTVPALSPLPRRGYRRGALLACPPAAPTRPAIGGLPVVPSLVWRASRHKKLLCGTAKLQCVRGVRVGIDTPESRTAGVGEECKLFLLRGKPPCADGSACASNDVCVVDVFSEGTCIVSDKRRCRGLMLTCTSAGSFGTSVPIPEAGLCPTGDLSCSNPGFEYIFPNPLLIHGAVWLRVSSVGRGSLYRCCGWACRPRRRDGEACNPNKDACKILAVCAGGVCIRPSYGEVPVGGACGPAAGKCEPALGVGIGGACAEVLAAWAPWTALEECLGACNLG